MNEREEIWLREQESGSWGEDDTVTTGGWVVIVKGYTSPRGRHKPRDDSPRSFRVGDGHGDCPE
jgi:hypothetical protein